MGYPVQQATTTQPLLFLLILSSDHLSPATGKTPTVTISKNGAAFASPAGAVAEISGGWYKVAGNATDNATGGPLALHVTEASSDNVDDVFPVVGYNPLSTTNLGLSGLPTANPGAANGVFIAGSNATTTVNITGSLSGSVGSVTAGVTVTTYTGNTPQTGDAFARLGAPSGASTAADILVIMTSAGAGLGAAVATANTSIGSNLGTAVAAIKATTDAINLSQVTGTVTDGSPTVNSFIVSGASLSASAGFYSLPTPMVMEFTSGNLLARTNKVTGYTVLSGVKTAIFAKPWPIAPATSDTFALLGYVDA